MMARSGVQLLIRQQPKRAMVVQESNPKNRKPVDPPPIVELKYENERDDRTNGQWLVSPRTFMMCTLIEVKDGKPDEETAHGKFLLGQTVSSLHRLKDPGNKDGGFFVFGDVSAKKVGFYKLRFSLFDSTGEPEEVHFMGHIDSDKFQVFAQRDFGSMSESTPLTRTFSDQGVKLRVRKENRTPNSTTMKRPYNSSPAVSSSPHHTSLFGGPVQDHHYSSTTPDVKRQRADSDYGSQPLYSGLSIPDSTFPSYNGSIPSSTRQWASDENQHRQNYSQHSPLNPPMMNRMHSINLPTTAWQNMHQNSALPSPSPSINPQTPSYASASSQAPSSTAFGDHGTSGSIPRHYYTGYHYPSQSQYETTNPGDTQSPYHDLQIPVTTLSGATGLGSTHAHAYTHGYMSSGAVFDTEAGESNGAYAYMDPTVEKYPLNS